MSLDLSRLSASDAAVALRSYPRRYTHTLRPIAGDPGIDELATRAGPDGRSALDLVVDTTNTFVVLGQALRALLVQEAPVLHPAVLDPGARTWEVPATTGIADALARLGEEADALATAVEATAAPDWVRAGTVAGGTPVTALDVVREAARTGAENLRAAEVALESARR